MHKYQTKKELYKKIMSKKYEPGDLVLLFNSQLKLFPGKLKAGPF